MGCVLSAYLRMLHTQLLLGLLQEAGGEDWCGVDFQRRVFVEVNATRCPLPSTTQRSADHPHAEPGT